MCALVSQDKTRLTRLAQRLQDILKNIKNSQTCSQNTSNVVHNNFLSSRQNKEIRMHREVQLTLSFVLFKIIQF